MNKKKLKKESDPTNFRKAKMRLDCAVLTAKSCDEIVSKLIDYYGAVLCNRVKAKGGVYEEGENICWIVYQDEMGVIFADAYMMIFEICEYSPHMGIVPEGATVYEANIFGMFNDYCTEVVPCAALLLKYGFRKIYYHGWKMGINMYGRSDILKQAISFAKSIQYPDGFEKYKKELTEKRNGILTVKDLAFLRQLKHIGEMV